MSVDALFAKLQESPQNLQSLASDPTVVPLLVQVGDKIWSSLSAVKYGTALLLEVAKKDISVLQPVIRHLKTRLDTPTTKANEEEMRTRAMRILFLFADLSRQSVEAFKLIENENCLPLITKQFDTDDVLEALTGVELLELLGASPVGMDYIVKSGSFSKILSTIEGEDDCCGGLFKDKCIDLITALARLQIDEITAKLVSSELILALIAASNDERMECKDRVVTAVGAVGASASGLFKLHNAPDLLEFFTGFLDYPSVENKVVFLKAFGDILERKTTEPEEVDMLQNITLRFNHAGNTLASLLLNFLTKPFWELREAAYIVLKGLARYGWGLQQIFTTPGLPENLINRNAEMEVGGMTWKFVILQTIVGHPKAKEIVGLQPYYDCLQYVKQGMHYKRAEAIPILKDEFM